MHTHFNKNGLLVILLVIMSLNFPALHAASNNDDFLKLTTAMQPGEWKELPGAIGDVFVDRNKTQGDGDINGPMSVIVSWNGAAWDDNCGYFLGGGHADYGGNEVYSYCWKGKQAFRWEVLMPPSKADPSDKSDCPHPKAGPRAYHTYDGVIYLAKTKSIFIWGTVGYCLGHMFGVDELPELVLESTPKWILHPPGPILGYAHTAYNDKNGKVYIWQGNDGVYKFDPKTFKYDFAGGSTPNYGANTNMIYDSQRNVLWTLTDDGLFQFILNPAGDVTELKLISAATQYPEKISGGDGMLLRKGKLYFWAGNNVVNKFDPDTGAWTKYRATGKTPTRISSYGIFSKWQYLEEYDVFVGVSHYQQGMWVWKPEEGKGETDTRKISVCSPDSKTCTEHKFLAQALTGIKPGSELKFTASHYTDGALIKENNLTLTGEPGVSFVGLIEGNATFVAAGNDMVFENMDISLPIQNGFSNEACIRGEGVNLTLRNIVCHDMQMGIIGGPGLLKIEHSKFEISGLNIYGDMGHLVYACSSSKCPNGALEIRDSTFTKIGVNHPGYGIKSHAPKNLLENTVISGLDLHSGRAIDMPQGGDTLIKNVVMEFGENSDNDDFIGIAMEYKTFPMHENTNTRIENVIAICDRSQPCDLVHYHGPTPKLKNVVLIGNFTFNDILYPISRDEIKMFPNRAAAGLPPYPYIPEKWLPIPAAK